jgi:hypothetical protein
MSPTCHLHPWILLGAIFSSSTRLNKKSKLIKHSQIILSIWSRSTLMGSCALYLIPIIDMCCS